MTVNRTTLLDLPLPVTGTESGTWGDTTNNGLTQYLDIAIAGTLVLSTDADVTLTSTEGDSSATNIGATTAQYAILRWTATGSTTRNITALAQSKTYVVINATGGTQSIVLRGAGPTTGVTIISGEKALCVWNGSDFVKVSSSAAAGGSNTQVQYNSSGVLAGVSGATTNGTAITFSTTNLKLQGSSTGVSSFASANSSATNYTVTFPAASTTIPVATQTLTFSGPTAARTITLPDANFTAARTDAAQTFTGVQTFSSNPVLDGGTANGVLYLNGSKVATSGSALTFDGTNLATTGTTTGSRFITSSTDASGTLLHVSTASTAYGLVGGSTSMGWNAGSQHIYNIGGSEQMRLTSTGLGIGTSSPARKLDVNGSIQIPSNNALYINGSSNYLYADTSAMELASATQIKLVTNGALRATLDSSGNLGLGVTPSTYNVGRAVEVGAVGNSFWTTSNDVYLTANTFYQSGYKYAASTYASMYEQTSGAHKWFTAPSGTAGNAITFTQAMTLDASGNLALGLTSASGRLHVQGSGEVAIIGSSAQSLYFRPDSGGTMIATGAGQTGVGTYYASTSNFMYFMTNNAERARITSGGDLLVGTTTSSGKVTIEQSAFATGLYVNSASGAGGANIHHRVASTSSQFALFTYVSSDVGSITTNGTVTLYNTTSDERLKENIANADSSSAIIDSLQVRKFDWKSDGSHQRYGFVAQELVTVAPEAVYQPEDSEAMMAVDYSKLVPMLVKEIQSLRQRVALLEGN